MQSFQNISLIFPNFSEFYHYKIHLILIELELNLTNIVKGLEHGFLAADGVGQEESVLFESGEQGGGRGAGVKVT